MIRTKLIIFLNFFTFVTVCAHGEPDKLDAVLWHATISEIHYSKPRNNNVNALTENFKRTSFAKGPSFNRGWRYKNPTKNEGCKIFCYDLKFKFRISENMNLILSYN